jgi:hypothetical protein
MLPTLTFDANKNDTYTFTLWRDDKKVVHEFCGFSVSINEKHETVIHGASSVQIHMAPEASFDAVDLAKINGPSCDGNFYYIYIEPCQGEGIMIWLSKEEFDILEPILIDIEETRYENQEYEFTRTTLRDMDEHPEKYGPEQRARAMVSCPVCDGALVGSVYRPHCESCSWDSNDAYKEHPP